VGRSPRSTAALEAVGRGMGVGSNMAAMEIVAAVVAPSSATAVEFDSRGLLPPSSCCVVEPSEDTPGSASHLHLQRRGTTKEGNEG